VVHADEVLSSGSRPHNAAPWQMAPTQRMPRHYHTNVHDANVVAESIRIILPDPKEELS
jgi:hypothetical protein